MRQVRNIAGQIEELLQSRILILDGPMETMIQTFKHDESAYRGKFKDQPAELQGHNDLLNITQPDLIKNMNRHVGWSRAASICCSPRRSSTLSTRRLLCLRSSDIFLKPGFGSRSWFPSRLPITAAAPFRDKPSKPFGTRYPTQSFCRLASTVRSVENRCGRTSKNCRRSHLFT